MIHHLRKLIMPLPASAYTAGEVAFMDICEVTLKVAISMHLHL